MPCRCTSLSPLLFFCYKEVYGALQKPCQCATDSSDSSCCLTKYIIDNVWPSNCSRFTHTCTHDNTHSVIFNHTRTHAPTHTRSHTHTHTHRHTHTHSCTHTLSSTPADIREEKHADTAISQSNYSRLKPN